TIKITLVYVIPDTDTTHHEPLSLHDALPILWPPAPLPAEWEDAGIVDSRAERHHVLQRLQSQAVAHVVLVCDVHQTPDRGVIAWLSELAAYGEHCSIVLYATGSSEPAERLQAWLYRLEAAGFKPEQIVTHFDALLLR